MAKNTRVILVCSILLGAAIFSSLRYVNTIHQKIKLESRLSQANQQVGFLEEQLALQKELAAGLDEEKSGLTSSLEEAEDKISRLQAENTNAQDRVVSLIEEIRGLQEAISWTKEEEKRQEQKLSILEERNAQLERRLGSIPELKIRIKELKIQMRKSRLKSRFQPSKRSRKAKNEGLYGNLGFLIRDGVSTYKPRIRIEVESAR